MSAFSAVFFVTSQLCWPITPGTKKPQQPELWGLVSSVVMLGLNAIVTDAVTMAFFQQKSFEFNAGNFSNFEILPLTQSRRFLTPCLKEIRRDPSAVFECQSEQEEAKSRA
ncbi:hypothetical protein ACIP66_23605 [Pseudomonas sp. NPDC088429]|uniref:hypothetical protein n=1 Tax=Pseudomonas sp. NPDC088429 TaxID=3364455 RepID=UPI00380DE5FA